MGETHACIQTCKEVALTKSFPPDSLLKCCSIFSVAYLGQFNDENWKGKYRDLGGCEDRGPERPVKLVWSTPTKIVNQSKRN